MDRPSAAAVVRSYLAAHGRAAVADSLILPALESVGARWEAGSLSLSQVYMAGRICEALLDTELPVVGGAALEGPRLGIGVLEDRHGLGKRMVSSVLRATGRSPVDFGEGLSAPVLARRAAEAGTEILLVSVLVLTSALRVTSLVDELRRAGSTAKVVVGGAPFRLDPKLGREVGADAWGRTAADAVRLVEALTEPLSRRGAA